MSVFIPHGVALTGVVLAGARAPVAGDGQDGDVWLDITSLTGIKIYGAKVSGAWPTTFKTIAAS